MRAILDRMRGMSPGEIAGETYLRTRRRLGRTVSRAFDRPDAAYVSDDALNRAILGESISSVAAHFRNREEPHLTPGLGLPGDSKELLLSLFPESHEEACVEAEGILEHSIVLFGETLELGESIDWRRDPVTGVEWPSEHYTKVRIVRGGGSDVRRVWELNRLHHFVSLGRAYALTGDERYAGEFLLQFSSWYESNPPRHGVNWAVAMEVAIRAVNLIAALELFRGSPQFSDEVMALALKSLLAHGRHIRSNLEYSYRAPSNHYLSNLIGLFALGITMPYFDESSRWVEFSAGNLLTELDRQVHPDGVSYEGSTGYHRFVLELFTLFFTLARGNRIEIPGRHWEKLESMFDFVRHYLKPDGTAPLIGDSDDGRLIMFARRPAIDHSYLLSLGAVLLENETFKVSNRMDGEAIWWYGPAGFEAFESLAVGQTAPASRGFEQAGIYIQREGSLFSIVDCGDHGIRGRGSHAHSDALSIEIFAHDSTFLRDPGTYVYTASEKWRNRFRSTAYHNTARVDRAEISAIRKGALFSLGRNVRPTVNDWSVLPESVRLDAEHHAYRRLAEPVTHRRVLEFDLRRGFWLLEDYFDGQGEHDFELFFNFESGLKVSIEGNRRAIALSRRAGLAVVVLEPESIQARLATRWVSTSYGNRTPSSGIIFRLYSAVPLRIVSLLIPFESGSESRVDQLVALVGDGRMSAPGSADGGKHRV